MASERTREQRTVYWSGAATDGCIKTIDQRALPGELIVLDYTTVPAAVECIATMVVRGAPAIGAMGGYAMVFAARELASDASPADRLAAMETAKTALDAARPTAVNLSWATQRIVEFSKSVQDATDFTEKILAEAERLADQDVAINLAMAKVGAAVVPQNANILTHCNTGALATVDVGTAIGVIYECHHQGKNVHVWVDETRPRLQGARLSAWELMREGVPIHLVADNASGLLMLNGKVDIVLYGADRVAANGDVVNKIGTYKVSVVARENGVPVYPVVPTSTIDLDVACGADIEIEERSDEEVACVGGVRVAPENVPVYNPAFDVTPAKYVTGIITEEGICYPPFNISLRAAKERAEAKIKQAQA
mmetsp:Transcript_4133/g.7899  ORF Transcript_4133/g.7899 Transcript_4133/m.7899 type:complete len:366 (-) Transcript_4133:21-1118(-)|eukprot:CAMPEP_0184543766 /NCGR_PEP_ID=MMETSP0199_2-20130426/3160_1 /TAXON_ID=1112570 /ORGANISM="Thraustochytrium sp., Strain LLF1b" /LENGTH=365 /DNA_ID=CAMNT_0026937837 /DNA_START=78 /DNA_END=1175 /DNA_ORIENTATION=+